MAYVFRPPWVRQRRRSPLAAFTSPAAVPTSLPLQRRRISWEHFRDDEWWMMPGFSSGFSSGFSVAVEAEPDEPKVLHGGGIPVLPRHRRGRSVELEGFGLITIMGVGELAVEHAVAGVIPIILIGSANLEVDLSEEALALALLGIPPDSGRGLELWAMLN